MYIKSSNAADLFLIQSLKIGISLVIFLISGVTSTYAASITYDFESDTVGQQPTNTTLERGGTAVVVDDVTLGSKAVRLSSSLLFSVLLSATKC